MARAGRKQSTGADQDDLFRIERVGSQETRSSAVPATEAAPESHIDGQGSVVKRQAVLPRKKAEMFFVDPQLEVILKSEIPSMEHPVYSMSKTPDHSVFRYEHNGNWLEITPSAKGRATIYDKDILLYVTSHLVRAINDGRPVSPYVRLTANDFLRFANRGSGGKSYELLRDAFTRLTGTRIQTNVSTTERNEFTTFGIIENARIIKENKDGRMLEVELKLSDWVFSAINSSQVLTLHPDYFMLRRPLARRLYELARKHCGGQVSWIILLENAMIKSGSKGPLKEFRRQVKEIIEDAGLTGNFPDYDIELEGESLVFRRKSTSRIGAKPKGNGAVRPTLKTDTYERARKVAPGLDVYALERDWIDFWETNGRPAFKSADAAFIGFCKSRFERQER